MSRESTFFFKSVSKLFEFLGFDLEVSKTLHTSVTGS